MGAFLATSSSVMKPPATELGQMPMPTWVSSELGGKFQI